MKKIIAAIDAVNFSAKQLQHFNSWSIQANGKLVAVFLENIAGEPIEYLGALPSDVAPLYAELNWQHIDDRRKIISEKIKLFDDTCEVLKINASLHEDEKMPLEEIIRESKFADLLLIENNISFNKLFESDPPRFVKEVLRESQCPVLLLPSEKKDVKELFFAYNGTASSMYAIRSFTNLFNDYTNKPVTIMFVDEHKKGIIPDEKLLKEYMQCHYKTWTTTIINGDEPAFELMSFLMNKSNYLVTLGAYGRSNMSQFFRKSDAKKLLTMLNTNIFITHP